MVILSNVADGGPPDEGGACGVRYGKERKQATRRRIIETAGRRFKADGIDGSGIAALMADAGLTNGAFYAHFDSKDDLVATAVADQLREQCESLGAAAPGHAGVEQILRAYLSVQHRDSPEHGCPSAALLDEIARCADATKRAYTDGILASGALYYGHTSISERPPEPRPKGDSHEQPSGSTQQRDHVV